MNLLRGALESAAVERLGWTLLHFVWEGAAVAVVLAVALVLLRRRGAGVRYAVSCAALVALAALPTVTFVTVPVTQREQNAVAAAAATPIPLAPARIPAAARGSGAVKPARPARGTASLVGLDGAPSAISAPAGGVRQARRAGGATPQAPGEGAAATLRRWGRGAIDKAAPALPWAVLGWGAGVLLLSTWNLGGWAAMRRLRSWATSDVPDDVAHSAARLCGRIGLRRAVRVLRSAVVDSPMVIGALKPVILLPAGLLTGLSPAQLDALLAHELAHVRRHDYLVNLLQGVIETVLFYHPAVWWVSRRIRVEREHCCDDAVVALTDDRAAYAGALAAVAETAAARRASAWSPVARLAPAASGGTLLARVRRVLGMPDADAARSPRWLAGAVAMALCLLAATAVITRGQDKPADKPAAQKDKDFDLPADKVLDLEVIDKASGEPMPTVTLSVQLENQTRAFSTDGTGHARIEYAPSSRYLSVTAKPDGYVPTRVQWRGYNSKDAVPDKFTLELEKGTTIGGIVQDEAGQPIAGVTVQLILHRKNEDGNSQVSTAIWDYPCKTDEQGRWQCDVAPADLDDPWIRLSHPDYLSDEMYGMTPKPPVAKLRDQSGVMVLKKGVALAGRVLDDQGKPVAGAKVMQGRDRFGSHFPDTKTDAQGTFRFAQVRKGSDVVLTVTARGRAPDQKTLRVEKDTTDVEFRLEPGRVVKGRVVDPQGNPVAGVLIATDTWRGNRALLFRANTDGQGRWTWKEAPSDEVLTDILHDGFMDLRQVPIKAGDQEQTFTLKKPLHVTAKVVDAETGKPVERFKVVQGIDWGRPGQPVYWERQNVANRPRPGGTFEYDVTFPRHGYAARVEADGYLPADSRVFRDADGPVVSLEFKLKKGQPLTGVVRGPDGKPAAGADVVLCIPPQGAYVRNGEIQQRRENVIVQTDNAGRYRLPPQAGPFALVVLHDRGYAEVKADQVAKSADVTLAAWGRVTGTVRTGSRPSAGAMMSVNRVDRTPQDPTAPHVYHDLQAQADADGRFTFDRVPPGPAQVSVQVKLSENTTTYTQTTPVEVKAGETVDVKIGGQGRPVVGRVVVPDDVKANVDWSRGQSSFSTKVKVPRPRLPDNWQDMDDAAKRAWANAWQQSPEGKAQTAASQQARRFSMRVNLDGTFRTDDVPAGTYQMILVLNGPPAGQKQPFGEPLATATHEFTIPEIPGGQSDEPFDVGAVEMRVLRHPKVGDPVPPLSAVTPDGKPLKLSDFKGKYVVAHFEAPWGTNPPADAARLRTVHDRFGADPRVALLDLRLEERPADGQKPAADKAPPWTRAFLGDPSQFKEAADWSLRSLPTTFLIGPDGKVIAIDVRPDALESELAAALGGPAPRP